MFRVLVVDDEPQITDGIFALVDGHAEELGIEAHKAYHGPEALQLAENLRIDVLLTDITMPVMTGFELHERFVRLWPKGRTLFLTGHDDFNYAKDALTEGVAGYVLKSEGDEVLLATLRRTLRAVEEADAFETLHEELEATVSTYQPLLQHACLRELIDADRYDPAEASEAFGRLDIDLEADRDLFLLVGTVDDWTHLHQETLRLNAISRIDRIVHKYLSPVVKLSYTVYERRNIVWFVQRRSESHPKSLYVKVKETLEQIQRAVSHILGITVSFALDRKETDWSGLSHTYRDLDILLAKKPYLAQEVVLVKEQDPTPTHRTVDLTKLESVRIPQDEEQGVRLRLNTLEQMSLHLSSGHITAFFETFNPLFDAILASRQLSPGFLREVYMHLLLAFVTYLNRTGIYETVRKELDVDALYAYDPEMDWRHIKDRFRLLAESIFRHGERSTDSRNDSVVSRVEQFVRENLSTNTSLTAIADSVHLNTSYLSRLYKSRRGHSITDFILALKLAKAKEILRRPEFKIYEVAAAVGYDNPSYFTQFFRKHCRMSPQEYRNRAYDSPK